MKQHDHLSSKEEIDNIKLWEINYASLVHTLLKGISEEEYEEMAKEQISASGLRYQKHIIQVSFLDIDIYTCG